STFPASSFVGVGLPKASNLPSCDTTTSSRVPAAASPSGVNAKDLPKRGSPGLAQVATIALLLTQKTVFPLGCQRRLPPTPSGSWVNCMGCLAGSESWSEPADEITKTCLVPLGASAR